MLSPETGEGVHYCLEGRFGLGELVVVSRTISSVWRICAPLQWGAIVGEQAYLPAHRVALWRPRRAAFRALFNFQRVVVHCTVRRPEAAVETDTAYGLEQQLLTALIEVLTDMPAKTG